MNRKDMKRERLVEILILSEKGGFYVGENGEDRGRILVICSDESNIEFYTQKTKIQLSLEKESNLSIRELSAYSYLITTHDSDSDKQIYISKNR